MQRIDEEGHKSRRRRARGAQGRQFDTSVPSPCISVCQIDNSSGTCIGCRRTLDEIRDWPVLSADDKRHILSLIESRKTSAEPSDHRTGTT